MSYRDAENRVIATRFFLYTPLSPERKNEEKENVFPSLSFLSCLDTDKIPDEKVSLEIAERTLLSFFFSSSPSSSSCFDRVWTRLDAVERFQAK